MGSRKPFDKLYWISILFLLVIYSIIKIFF
jgi:hypothetical protein